jgi:hypothetical protein
MLRDTELYFSVLPHGKGLKSTDLPEGYFVSSNVTAILSPIATHKRT